MCFAMVMPLAGAIASQRLDYDDWLSFLSVAWVILTAIGYFTVPAQCRSLRNRFIEAANRWDRCFPCGYDQRMIESEACPECGYKNPHNDPSQTPGVN